MSVIIVTTLIVVIGIYYIFNPYLAGKWRTNEELWKTREQSHGWPFYSQLLNDPQFRKTNTSCLTNTPCKVERRVGNIIYIE